MADTRLNPGEYPAPKNKGNRTIIFAVIIIALLLGLNIFMYVKYYNKQGEAQKLTEQVNTDNSRITDLEQKYQEALVNIESYKGQNATLDSIITVKEKELMRYKANLDALKKQNKLSEADYKTQLQGLQGVVDDLQTQIAQLQQQNSILITKNDSLGQTLATQINTNAEQQSVISAQTKKIQIASLLRPTAITATGVRAKSNGKESETNTAKKAEKIKVCFDLPVNTTAELGQKTFLVRLISPEGVTIAVQSMGSGVFTVAESTEERQYTVQTTADYQQTAQNVCAYWQQGSPFMEGQYTAEIYQDGYMIGTTKFELK